MRLMQPARRNYRNVVHKGVPGNLTLNTVSTDDRRRTRWHKAPSLHQGAAGAQMLAGPNSIDTPSVSPAIGRRFNDPSPRFAFPHLRCAAHAHATGVRVEPDASAMPPGTHLRRDTTRDRRFLHVMSSKHRETFLLDSARTACLGV